MLVVLEAESVEDTDPVALAEMLLNEAVAESVLVLEADGVTLALLDDVENTLLEEDAPTFETVDKDPVPNDESTLVESPVEIDAESVEDTESVALAEALLVDPDADSVFVPSVEVGETVEVRDGLVRLLVKDEVLELDRLDVDPETVEDSVLVDSPAELEAVAEVLVLSVDVCDDAESVLVPSVDTTLLDGDDVLKDRVSETVDESVLVDRPIEVVVDADSVEDTESVALPEAVLPTADDESVLLLGVEVWETVLLLGVEVCDVEVKLDRVPEADAERVLVDCSIEIELEADRVEDAESVALTDTMLIEPDAESVDDWDADDKVVLVLNVDNCDVDEDERTVLELSVDVCETVEDSEPVLLSVDVCDEAEDEESTMLLSVDVCEIVAVTDEEEAVLGRSLAPHTPLLMAGPTLDLRQADINTSRIVRAGIDTLLKATALRCEVAALVINATFNDEALASTTEVAEGLTELETIGDAEELVCVPAEEEPDPEPLPDADAVLVDETLEVVPDPATINFAPQTPPLGTAAPRDDFR
ncbi:hypothetical protein LTR56_014769 [Elasticomyces elasticus]|nr:hypothetical protein LTR56_014769 [Elasticomyces elasticus]KAK5752349.1 hypothetical protein LTS12_017568 [Elasticomyces elasticus]